MKIAVLGFGVVGSGVYEVLGKNYETVAKRAGKEIDIKYILDIRDFPGHPAQELMVKDYNMIVNDPEVQIIVEVMGGTEPAYSFVKEALLKGKSVCTSNKELVAKHGAELLEIAKQKKVNFLFEASVGGGIPIIRPLNQSLTADEILEITGILNGTTNYMLSRMQEAGQSFEAVLQEAQEKGYAEKDPVNDIEGYDTGRKIAILTSLAHGSQVDFADIHTEGITKITEPDMQYAKALHAKIKLLGSSKKMDGKIYALTAPAMIPKTHPLYPVDDVNNAVLVKGNVVGNVLFYGSGAGKMPTASAVVSDVVDAVKHTGTNILTIWSSRKLELEDFHGLPCRFFVRVEKQYEEAARESFAIWQEVAAEGISGEFAFLTERMDETAFLEKAAAMPVLARIRTEF